MTTLHAEAKINNAVFIRLSPGTDLITGIAGVCRENEIRAASIASCISSLRRASFFVVVPMGNRTGGGYSDPVHLETPLEIVSAQGTVGEEESGEVYVHRSLLCSLSSPPLLGGRASPGWGGSRSMPTPWPG